VSYAVTLQTGGYVVFEQTLVSGFYLLGNICLYQFTVSVICHSYISFSAISIKSSTYREWFVDRTFTAKAEKIAKNRNMKELDSVRNTLSSDKYNTANAVKCNPDNLTTEGRARMTRWSFFCRKQKKYIERSGVGW